MQLLRLQDRWKIDPQLPMLKSVNTVEDVKHLRFHPRSTSSTIQQRILKIFGHISKNKDFTEILTVQGHVEGKITRDQAATH